MLTLQGSPLSWEEVLDRYSPLVFRLAWQSLGNRQDAEDAAQEVFVALVRSSPAFRDETHLRAWLIRATSHRCKNLATSAWKRHTVPLDPGYTSAQTLEKIAWSAPVGMGMGGSDDTCGSFMVHDLEEMTGVNPTLDNTDRMKELPVYKNPIPSEEEQLRFAQNVAAALGTEITDYESSGPETGSPYRFFSADMADGGRMTMENLISCHVWLPERLSLPDWADTLERPPPCCGSSWLPWPGLTAPPWR